MPAIAARSGSFGSKNGSGWMTRISDDSFQRRGSRLIVHATMEMTMIASPALNHVDLNTWNSCSRSSASTTATPIDAS